MPHRKGLALDCVITDRGPGIRATLERNPDLQVESDEQALRLAVQELTSGTGQSRLILVRGKIPGSSSSGSLTSPENGQLQHKRREFQRVGGLSITFKPQTRANVISD